MLWLKSWVKWAFYKAFPAAMTEEAQETDLGHTSVLLQETIDGLALSAGKVAIDATTGGGGHTQALAQAVGPKGTVLAIDRDTDNIARARKRLTNLQAEIHFVLGNFRDIEALAQKAGITAADAIVFDLGWSSFHLDSGRGFSFKQDEPLLMTYEATPSSETLTAKEIVNTWEEEHIADILYGFGEERFSRRIARAIAAARKEQSIETTGQLVAIIESAVPGWYKHGKIHPATRTFQALRIAVNDELEALERGLSGALSLLANSGRIAVISFHSLEDRIVKRFFKDKQADGWGEICTKRPITASREEIQQNPRSRSAKLRIFTRITEAP